MGYLLFVFRRGSVVEMFGLAVVASSTVVSRIVVSSILVSRKVVSITVVSRSS